MLYKFLAGRFCSTAFIRPSNSNSAEIFGLLFWGQGQSLPVPARCWAYSQRYPQCSFCFTIFTKKGGISRTCLLRYARSLQPLFYRLVYITGLRCRRGRGAQKYGKWESVILLILALSFLDSPVCCLHDKSFELWHVIANQFGHPFLLAHIWPLF